MKLFSSLITMVFSLLLALWHPPIVTGADITPPVFPEKLIFIHHSTGGHWLADPNEDNPHGGLGTALKDNNYFVSATNYCWGPDEIGSRTDILNWPEWFTGPGHTTIMAAVFNETGQNFTDCDGNSFGSWSRLATNPGGENAVILIKSCFPNSDLYGDASDPPAPAPNGWEFSVANAKAIYNEILTYFATRQDKLFIVITAPPMTENEYNIDPDLSKARRAANARAFNNWLVTNWLDGYAHNNVAVFDYFNVLTHPDNHHRVVGASVEHVTSSLSGNFAYYPLNDWDSHPNTTGQQKATQEFVPLLNSFYNTWKNAAPSVVFGDINGDGAVNLSDAVAAFKVCAAMPVPGLIVASEVNNDGRINLAEAIYALQTTAGIHHAPPAMQRVQPADFQYLGAFRLPDAGDRPLTFAYGGNAMSFNPEGDPTSGDAFPGSLFVMGHDRMAYGEVPDGNQIAEVTIPTPADESSIADLPQADFIQNFHNPLQGHFTDMEEIPKAGMQYLNHPDTGPKLHICWGQHLQPDNAASHAWINADLSVPDFKGTWFIGSQNLYSVNGYMFDIPAAWADANASGRYLATGRMRDGGQGGMGPTLFAYRPWLAGGAAPASGSHLEETVLLLYDNAYNTDQYIRCMSGYQHADEWEGGAWITTPSGKTAVLFAGTKATGTKCWYGYRNALGPEYPCVDADVTDFTTCRMADGSPCPAGDFNGCGESISYRGWWSTRFDAQFILYDPADFKAVAAGAMDSWEPQPYATIDIDEHLYLNVPEWDVVNVGEGVQRRYRIGDAAYDRRSGLLYVLEQLADEGKPVVHVWQVQ